LSKTSLGSEDLAALRALLSRAAKSGTVWKGFQEHYTPDILKDAMRPL
jgi:polar amino acid transport system substrate-binding protein